MTGVQPAAITSTQVCEPMKPVAPVSRTMGMEIDRRLRRSRNYRRTRALRSVRRVCGRIAGVIRRRRRRSRGGGRSNPANTSRKNSVVTRGPSNRLSVRPTRRKPTSAASSAAAKRSPRHIPLAEPRERQRDRDDDGQDADPTLLEQDLHPEIEDVPRQVVVGREEPARAAAGKIAVRDQIIAGLVEQPHIVDVDDASRLRIGEAQHHGPSQQPGTRPDVARRRTRPRCAPTPFPRH